jgi:hypothetical protein
MTRLILAIGTAALLLGAPLGAHATDAAAPAAETGQAASKDEGCMPGGGCCGGSAACPKAERTADGKSAGCPCQKAKQAAEQAAPPAQP